MRKEPNMCVHPFSAVGLSSFSWGTAIAALSLVGCSQGNTPTDAPMARQSLATALESWKAGDPPSKIREASPSILMVDSAWDSGQKLDSFQVVGPEFDDGVNLF